MATETKTRKISEVISAMGRKRDLKRKAEARASALGKEMDELADEIETMLKAQGLESGSSRTYIASRTQQEVARITDYGKFRTWVYKNDGLDLLQNRLSITSIRERRDNGEKIPGIHVEKLNKISLRKKPARG